VEKRKTIQVLRTLGLPLAILHNEHGDSKGTPKSGWFLLAESIIICWPVWIPKPEGRSVSERWPKNARNKANIKGDLNSFGGRGARVSTHFHKVFRCFVIVSLCILLVSLYRKPDSSHMINICASVKRKSETFVMQALAHPFAF